MRRAATISLLVATAIASAACSGGGGETADATDATDATEATDPSATPGADDRAAAGDDAVGESVPDEAGQTADSVGEPTTVAFEIVEVPESGVPGIDSEDAFCAAWSRFGGSWQVIQVAANFAPDPTIVPAMEVVAAPVVSEAYDAMLSAWPGELADERDDVADGFFGPLDRRAEAALEELVDAGAAPGDVDAIGAAWVDALARRNPEEPTLTPELTDEQWALVDDAAAGLAARLQEFAADPSMRITVATPLTDAYLATACPDQGALLGGEIDAP